MPKAVLVIIAVREAAVGPRHGQMTSSRVVSGELCYPAASLRYRFIHDKPI